MDNEQFEFVELLGDQQEFTRVDAGTVLFREGDEGHLMYVVLEGEIQLTINEQVLGMEMDGGIVGEMALIDEARRSATATTITDCVLAPLDMAAFKALVQKEPEFAIYVMQVLSQRLRLANEILALF